jgi:tRNA 2-(methylsulfanyl)-N6-isopentenyladenosine37 hydroxylase
MMTLAQEEMRHFRQVLDRIEARGGSLGAPRPDRYVRALREWGFRRRGGIGALGDLLLVSAFVEARSCERFRLLAEGLPAGDDGGSGGAGEARPPGIDPAAAAELGEFYLRLAAAEARHWELFRDLVLEAEPRKSVERRIAEMAEAEGEIVASRPLEPRMH